MMSPETYTAELRDRPFGPVVERLEGLLLIERRPDEVLRRHVEQDGRRWIKVYEVEPEEREGQLFSYVLSYEVPEDIAADPGSDDEEDR
ncbi:hypothetical protein [Microbacterium sp. 22303]|uniref:hypothetical protein n=1 Tax=Microbacterium sp. 22303 TaxID=3453905 RepID=UPI003F84FCAA